MRLRNIKNKEEIITNCKYVIKDSKSYIGKWDKVFGNNNPIHIEIGMGMGKFIISNAIKNPNINFIGIEKQDNVLARMIRNRLDKIDDIPNLRIIRLNALEIDEVFFKDIDMIYLNFSDPWPKLRHNERRLTSNIFLEKYEKLFRGDKKINLRTDNQELFIYSIETLSGYGYKLNNVTFDLDSYMPIRITTEYEDKFIDKGNKIYSLFAGKHK